MHRFKTRINRISVSWGIALLSSLLLMVACQKKNEPQYMDAHTNFEALWKIVDEHYCFFEYKEVDWDEVYVRYKAQVKDSMTQVELFDLLGEMLSELKDGHTNLISAFNVARYWAWYEEWPSNFNQSIQNRYLGHDYQIAGGLKYTKLAEEQVGYVYYGSFSQQVGENNLNYLFKAFNECGGLIIDVRNNGGGSLTYSERIASRFIKEKQTVGYIIHKTGPKHHDFSQPYPIELDPSKYTRWFRPVVVLTNRHTYSAANDFVMKMRQFPQVTILGDRTGGGGGLPFNSELPNGWLVRFSASPMLNSDKQNTEDGIDPDIHVSLLYQDLIKGEDTLIEEAIKVLLKGQDGRQ